MSEYSEGDYPPIESNEKQFFVLEDVIHTGKNGIKDTSKIGERAFYENGHKVYLYKPLSLYEDYKGKRVAIMDATTEERVPYIRTSALQEIREYEEYVEVETENSIYVLKKR